MSKLTLANSSGSLQHYPQVLLKASLVTMVMQKKKIDWFSTCLKRAGLVSQDFFIIIILHMAWSWSWKDKAKLNTGVVKNGQMVYYTIKVSVRKVYKKQTIWVGLKFIVQPYKAKKKILCLKAATRICFSVRIWFCKIQTFIFFFLKLFFFHFYYEKQRKFDVLEEFKHVGAQKTCKILFDFWKYGSWNFSVIFGFACAWRQRPIEVKTKQNKKCMPRRFEKFSQALRQSIFF